MKWVGLIFSYNILSSTPSDSGCDGDNDFNIGVGLIFSYNILSSTPSDSGCDGDNDFYCDVDYE